ncbi:MAG: glutamate mutase L [Pseudomonadota bacterium]
MIFVSIDIGSTWTKGAAFTLVGSEFEMLRRAVLPTTVHHLGDAFFQVLDGLAGQPDAAQQVRSGAIKLCYSSSAKGGLAVAALGIVPEITLETAKVAAYSAGAKLTRVLSYRLTRSDIAALEQDPPDILLFAGGTDGGNCDYVLANARALAQSTLACSIVFAGNRAARDEVAELLAHKDFIAVDNVLPEMDTPNPEPARDAMRAIFLSRIVKGKGLDSIIERTGIAPLPTPYAMYEFAKQIRQHVPSWEEFLLLDMGGATTDVYSAHRESASSGTVLRGLPEPEVKRTVEGDLGMRISALAAAESGKALIAAALDNQQPRIAEFAAYVERVSLSPEHVPDDEQGREFDAILAGTCVAHACGRHAGRRHEVATADGLVKVQLGRDLTQVRRVIGSGGWLSRVDTFDPRGWLAQMRIDAKGKEILVPCEVDYYRDHDYLFPLLANLAQDMPEAAARSGVRALVHHNH